MVRIHAAAGALALVTILSFWTSSLAAEALGPAAITAIKGAIPWGMVLLIPALMVTGITGHRLAVRRRGPLVAARQRRMGLVAAKQRRMGLAAANGLLVLLPCAVVLARWSAAGAFGPAFHVLQAVELAAGALNITLLSLNMRDGLRMRGRVRAPRTA